MSNLLNAADAASRALRAPVVGWCVATIALLAYGVAAPISAQEPRPERGYASRACGFDMDRDGIWSEPEDCQVCDGLTTDPDGDLVDEDLIYIDCDAGADTAVCGSALVPCRTIDFAWTTRADGPGDGAEDILCFRGTCSSEEMVSPAAGGVPGTYSVPASGSQVRDWSYPMDPTMLVGWDSDGDGEYPPHDTDDVAVLDGAGLGRAFRLDVVASYLEMAHFTARDYGRFSTEADTGFVRFGPTTGLVEYLYFHDLELQSINMDRETTSQTSAINLFSSAARPQWIQFANLNVLDNGQWFVRGAGPDTAPDAGPLRFINIYRTAHSCDFDDCGSSAGTVGFKAWGYLSQVEILDSIFDANVAGGAWQPKDEGGPSGATFAFVVQCAQDWMIRNNEAIDHKIGVIVEGHNNTFCDGPVARPVTEITIDGNVIRNSYEPWRFGDHGIRIDDGGDEAGEVIGNIYITNNFLSSATGWEASIWSSPGHETIPPTGQIFILGNSIYGNVNRHGAIVLGDPELPDLPLLHQDYLIQNNLFGGFISTNGGEQDLNILTTYVPDNLQSDFNVFAVEGDFELAGARTGLGVWQATTGGDTNSRVCEPKLADAAVADLHLLPTDTCARDQGTEAFIFGPDIDGDSRPQLDGVDIGADEVSETLFADGFESAGVSAWSTSIGLLESS